MKKKIVITTSISLVVLLLIAVTVVLCVLFVPRNLKGLISEDGAVKVAILDSINKQEVYQMDKQEQKVFWEQLNKTKYEPQTDLIKGCSELLISIEYKDGSKIIFDEFLLTKYNSNGEIIKVAPIKVTMYVFEDYKDKLV